jgi:phosphoribosylamine--glycine ligase
MKVLLLGSGGRENALAWKLKQSEQLEALFIAPGNAGTSQFGTNIAMKVTDFDAIKNFCLNEKIDIIIPGGEDALVAGIYDYIKNDTLLNHIIVAGPSKYGAQLEGSKAFAKEFMMRHQIPTAAYREFSIDNFEEGLAYIAQHTTPIVLKADGLAAGKGVVITDNIEEALQVFTSMIKEAQFGDASKKVVIEQFLTGVEVSVFVMTNGEQYIKFPEAKDYKRIGEGDKGLNTGGMGAISPVPFYDTNFAEKVEQRIIRPTIEGLKKEQITYKGFVFFGLINVNGDPYVIEYNCRMGDPETEVVLPRLQGDLIEMIKDMEAGNFKDQYAPNGNINPNAACTVMMVSGGYPEKYENGKIISGLEQVEGSMVFHAGTKKDETGHIITNGGRVLAVTSYGKNIQEALETSYNNVSKISFDNQYYRTDIGYEFK